MENKDLLADSMIYQQTLEEGRKEGQRQMVVDAVQERFPQLAAFAQQQAAKLTNPLFLRRLIVKMSTVSSAQEAEQALLAIEQDEKRN